MSTRIILGLVISGLLIMLAGGIIDYQRRVRHRQSVMAHEQNATARRIIFQQRSDQALKVLDASVKEFQQHADDLAAKAAEMKAAAEAEKAALLRAYKAAEVRRMNQEAKEDLEAVRLAAEKERGL